MSIGQRFSATEELEDLSQQINALASRRDETVRQLSFLQAQIDQHQRRLAMLNELMRDRLEADDRTD